MNLTYLSMGTEKPICTTATHLRGFIANQFRKDVMFHNHEGESATVYGYPVVQYKLIDQHPVVIGIGSGASKVEALSERFSVLELGGHGYKVLDMHLNTVNASFGHAQGVVPYAFFTPWLALNEENYARYQASGPSERQRLLQRILIGNILSMSKGLGYVVTQEIKVSQLDVYPVRTPVRLKGVEMTGFKGMFAVNFDLPDLIGLGKSVSRGFGTVRKIGANRPVG